MSLDYNAIKRAAEERGIRIPEDLSLMGYDNISFGALWDKIQNPFQLKSK